MAEQTNPTETATSSAPDPTPPPAATDKAPAKAAEYPDSHLRGALKLEASTSTPVVAAGSEFSIYVVIRNPFPVPVTIYSSETHIPIELMDEIWSKEQRALRSQARQKQIDDRVQLWDRLSLRLKFLAEGVANMLSPDEGPRVAVAVSPESQKHLPRDRETVNINSQQEMSIGGDLQVGNRWSLNFAALSDDEVRKRLFQINEFIQGRLPVVLNPGDSVVKHFVLKTTRWLAFTPIAHTFQIQVRYEVDGQIHIDTVPFSLNLRAAQASSLIGALIGSFLGTLVSSKFYFADWLQFWRAILTAAIFAAIIVVAFARKSNVQQIVSVEDFWGGIFIGFLVGYSGQAFISSILGKPG